MQCKEQRPMQRQREGEVGGYCSAGEAVSQLTNLLIPSSMDGMGGFHTISNSSNFAFLFSAISSAWCQSISHCGCRQNLSFDL